MIKLKLNNQNLIAPCGLYCGECEAFQNGRCGGCISREGLCLKYSEICKIFDCCINNKNLRFCGECKDFPCKKFDFFKDKEYDWVSEVTKNLNKIKTKGAKEFLKEQIKRVEGLIECERKKGIENCSQCKDWRLCKKLGRPPVKPA